MTEETAPTMRPFYFHRGKAGRVRISCCGNVVKTLAGKAAARFLSRIDSADVEDQQRIMAKATGQFRFGNERLSRERSRRQ